MAPSGVEDAWVVGTDQLLEGDIRWVPTTDITDPLLATGWDGATGVRAFLEWAREKNIFRWLPDRNSAGYYQCYLQEPFDQAPELEQDATRKVHIVMRTTDDTPFEGY
jgi:hypothetical protein